MTTSYPGAVDSLTNPTSGDTLASPSHSAQHANANDAIEAIEAQLGVGDRPPGLMAGSRLLAYDEFSQHADGALSGKVPLVGAAWATTGASPTTVTSGRATASGGSSGYAVQTFSEPATYLECVVNFSGTDVDGQEMTMAWTSDIGFDDILHFNFGGQRFTVTTRNDGGSFIELLTGYWRQPIAYDGTTNHRFGVSVRGDTVTVIGPHGDAYSNSDPRVSGLASNLLAFWQPMNGATDCYMVSCRALARPYDEVDIALDPSPLDMTYPARRFYRSDPVVAGYESYWQTQAGQDPSGFLGITFGPDQVRTFLTSAVVATDGTIETDSPLPPGDAIIDAGDAVETVTVTGNPNPLPGAGHPYVATLTGTAAGNHPAGTVVMGSGYTRRTVRYNPLNDTIVLDAPVSLADGSSGMVAKTVPSPVYRSVSGAVTLDCTYGFQELDLSGSITSFAVSNVPRNGMEIAVMFYQDGIGAFTLSSPSSFVKFAGGACILTVTAGQADIYRFICYSSKIYEVSRSLNLTY